MTGQQTMKIALLGTGLMGQPLAERLLAAGYPVVVYHRTREKAERLRPQGAEIAERPEEAICSATCVILMLADAQAIRSVLFSQSKRAALAGRMVIQMGTIAPRESRAIHQEVVAAGGEYLEAPVLGSIPEAQAGNLIASLMAAFALSLGLVRREQIRVDTFMTILRESALYAHTFDKKLSRMLNREYANPTFPTRHLVKDVDLFLEEASHFGLETSALQGIRRLLETTLEQGWADADYSALFNAVNPDTS